MTNADVFLDLYKELEEAAKQKYGKDVYDLEKMPQFSDSKMRYCREVRNLLSHKPKIAGEFAVEPTEEMIEYLRGLVKRVENQPKAKDIMVRKSNLVTRLWTSNVLDTMKRMLVDDLTCIPILDSGRVVGVFSENTVFSFIAENGAMSIDQSMTIESLRKYVPISKHISEAFPFVCQDKLVSDIKTMFDKSFTNGTKRVALVFVTDDGTQKGQLLGVISSWDLAGTKLRKINR